MITRLSKTPKVVLRAAWDSPTLTTVVSNLVTSLRLLLVTPLILTRFSENEIALWYLFATVAFFNRAMMERLGITFSRMYSFAAGGATSLAPSTLRPKEVNSEGPNWVLFERTYRTQGLIDGGLSLVGLFLSLIIGLIVLPDLVAPLVDQKSAWLAFILFQLTAAAQFACNKYNAVLRGLFHVSLLNRWNVLFGFLSVLAGAAVLKLGAGLLILTITMQGFVVFGICWKRHLLNRIEGGKVRSFRGINWDREVFGWAYQPTWKGFIAHLGNTGAFQIVGLVFAKFGDPLHVATYLFSLRMGTTIQQFASSAVYSVTPKLSRMGAEGLNKNVEGELFLRTLFVIGALLFGFYTFGVIAQTLLPLIGANVNLVPLEQWFLFGAFFAFWQLQTVSITHSALGNDMIFYWNGFLALPFSLTGIIIFAPEMGSLAPIIFTFIPLFIAFGFGPFKRLWNLENKSARLYLQCGTMISLSLYLAGSFFAEPISGALRDGILRIFSTFSN